MFLTSVDRYWLSEDVQVPVLCCTEFQLCGWLACRLWPNRGFSLRMSSSSSSSSSPHVVVIGGGFGGFGAKGLCENGCKVTLIDAAEPTGKEPVVTKTGGHSSLDTSGFWRGMYSVAKSS